MKIHLIEFTLSESAEFDLEVLRGKQAPLWLKDHTTDQCARGLSQVSPVKTTSGGTCFKGCFLEFPKSLGFKSVKATVREVSQATQRKFLMPSIWQAFAYVMAGHPHPEWFILPDVVQKGFVLAWGKYENASSRVFDFRTTENRIVSPPEAIFLIEKVG